MILAPEAVSIDIKRLVCTKSNIWTSLLLITVCVPELRYLDCDKDRKERLDREVHPWLGKMANLSLRRHV
ncbi:hypothetical protein MJO28_013568 [Puccinia striiformis f. sp. tritici]|uniref:Uncharacterized protein n=1 Tax=Puccinia striiformis f. sp. tritici TaxID=168172 RepID=A0ACC0DV55_9BASI|nr:hypothetical protein MJO28_013568 [Puccinia striiformis f. sp. tritici]